VPAGGFWLALLGSVALAISGIAFATLDPDQLVSPRRAKKRRPPSNERKRRTDKAKAKPTASDTKPSGSEATRPEPGGT
jgi:hypothetical protein